MPPGARRPVVSYRRCLFGAWPRLLPLFPALRFWIPGTPRSLKKTSKPSEPTCARSVRRESVWTRAMSTRIRPRLTNDDGQNLPSSSNFRLTGGYATNFTESEDDAGVDASPDESRINRFRPVGASREMARGRPCAPVRCEKIPHKVITTIFINNNK